MTQGEATAAPAFVSRIRRFVLGPPVTRRLALTHVLDDFAVAFINVSLVGSLFVNVSVNASRGRIIAYLLLTALPLVVTAPLLGRALDRWHVDARVFIIGSQLLRAGAAVAMIPLRLSVAMYPLAFVVLASKKVYSLTKSTLLTELTRSGNELVAADSHLARWGSIVGSTGSAIGVGFVALGHTTALLICAVPAFAVAAWAASGLPRTPKVSRPAGRKNAGVELPRGMIQAIGAVTALRASSGALTYLLAFAVKRGGGDRWIYAAGLLAAGAGAMLSTVISPRVHRRYRPDTVLVAVILTPGVIAMLGIGTFGQPAALVIAFSIGLGNGVASRSIILLQAQVPVRARATAIARTELVFQLATVLGAAAAVWLIPSPEIGFAVTGAVLLTAVILYSRGLRKRHRGPAEGPLFA